MSDPRLQTDKNMWLASVRPDGRPHLTPIWFAIHNDKWYFVTEPTSVKVRNLQQNARVSLALEDGTNPHVVEGVARPVAAFPEIIEIFKEKYNWDITTDADYSAVFEVEVMKQLKVTK